VVPAALRRYVEAAPPGGVYVARSFVMYAVAGFHRPRGVTPPPPPPRAIWPVIQLSCTADSSFATSPTALGTAPEVAVNSTDRFRSVACACILLTSRLADAAERPVVRTTHPEPSFCQTMKPPGSLTLAMSVSYVNSVYAFSGQVGQFVRQFSHEVVFPYGVRRAPV
jgi:hypothetical protein